LALSLYLIMSDFQKLTTTIYGNTGECRIANWLKGRENHILPIYEKVDLEYKGPTLFASNGERYVAPDMLCINDEGGAWIEAKHKSSFTWYRKTETWQTGINLHHYKEYLKVQEVSEWPVWLLFLHEEGRAKDSPIGSPTGLFGRKLSELEKCIDHESDRHGKHGMVYWNHKDLIKLANLSEVY